MESLAADLRYGVRVLARSPLFTLVTIVTLALGIGANTAIFSTVDAALIRPLPYGEPDRVVVVWEDATAASFPRNTPAPANYVDWRARNRVFTEMAATRGSTFSLTMDGPPEQVRGRAVTPNFFSVLQARPVLGRPFTEDEDRDGARVVVISHGLWQRRYAGDPSLVGKTITMNGAATTVVGIMPRGFVFRDREIDYWIPIHFSPTNLAQRSSHYLQVVARLKPGVTLAQARADMTAIASQLAAEYPDTNSKVGAVVVPIADEVLGDTRLQLIVLTAAAIAVLLIACANLAGLLLARAIARRGEIAVRAALGAGQARLVRQLVVEALILAAAGGALGLVVAPAGMTVLARIVPAGLPPLAASALDARLLGFTLIVSIAAGLAFSIVPAVQASRASAGEILQHAGRSSVGAPGGRTRDALVVLQISSALVLLMAAGLLLRTLANVRALELGFRPDHLLTLETPLPQQKYADGAARASFFDRVVARVNALPGVESAAYGSMLPFMSRGNTIWYQIQGREHPAGDPGDVLLRTGTTAYLRTLGVAIVDGRLIDERDGADAPAAVVINETLARMYWPRGGAIGQRIQIGSDTTPWMTIVGVVRDVRERGYEPPHKPGIYLSYAQVPTTWAVPEDLIVRTAGDPLAIASAARQAVAAVDPQQPVSLVRTMDDIVELDVASRHQQATLMTTFAALALLLALLGLYGVLSYVVTNRSREIGLRIALGATRASVLRLVVRRGAALTAFGISIGTAGAFAAAALMRNLLYGMAPFDVATFAAVVGVLAVVGVAACAVPALRATRLSPLEVLREN